MSDYDGEPLLLFPLRLEYRVDPAETEVLFRWYPDDSFTEAGILPVAPHEQEALATARAALQERPWYDSSDPEVAAAFEALARQTSPPRAVHLLRSDIPPAAPDDELRIGRITALPSSVTLYAYGTHRDTSLGAGLTALATGKLIPEDFTYSIMARNPEDGTRTAKDGILNPRHWIYSFPEALANGMGVKLSDPALIKKALEAEWIIAVGLHPNDAVADVEALIRDGVANGRFSYLRQDSPTNNGSDETSHELDPMADLTTFHADASEHDRGRSLSGTAADLLSEALGIDPSLAHSAPRSADRGRLDAQAMAQVLMPALLDQVPESTYMLDGVDDEDLVDFFATWVTARGQLPAVRFGTNPYGVLPITRNDRLQVPPGDDAVDGAIDEFLRMYSAILQGPLASAARQTVPVITPGRTDAGTVLQQALALAPVSRRLDVLSSRTADDSSPVGCSYVNTPILRPLPGRSSPQHHPRSYLRVLRRTPIQELPDPTQEDRETPLLYRLARQSVITKFVRLGQYIALTGDGSALKVVGEVMAGLGALEQFYSSSAPNLSARLTQGTSAPGATAFQPVHDPDAAADFLLSMSRMTLTSFLEIRQLPGFDATLSARFTAWVRRFLSAVARIETAAAKPEGPTHLETLLFETVDLAQHRVDAWTEGLAYRRLTKRRRAGVNGLATGYYGMIGQLHTGSVTGAPDGYVQAPSPEQATTSAVLRSAHLRFSNTGAFDIHLSSGRVRHALQLYDLVQKGLSLEEILGLSGERWLHDKHLDRLIMVLRHRFPIHDPSDGHSMEIRLFDGRAFLNASLTFVTEDADQASLQHLQDVLNDNLDALSDLVMCEAAHQRVLGNPEAANAWLQVLSGDPGPGEPVFVRTRRHGHGSSHQLSMLIPATETTIDASPREIAEPSLAALANGAMTGFAEATVTVVLQDPSDPDGPSTQHRLSLGQDLGMTPFDLVVGGLEELRLRALATFTRWWQVTTEAQQSLGPAPATLRQLSAEHLPYVDLDSGPVPPSRLLEMAGLLRQSVSAGRWMQASDWHSVPAAHNAHGEANELLGWATSASVLRRRVQALAERLHAHRESLKTALETALARSRHLQESEAQGAEPMAIAADAAALEDARARLCDALIDVSHFSEPGAMVQAASMQLRTDPDGLDESGKALLHRLATKETELGHLLGSSTTGPVESDGRGTVEALREGLRQALDGAALPVLPPFEQQSATAPALGPTVSATDRLGTWTTARENVELARKAAEAYGLHVYPVVNLPADSPPALYSTIFSPSEQPSSLNPVAGVVLDEWAESQPDRQQTTGVALNYDAPQSEAPQCMLLCEPAAPEHGPWTTAEGAEMVAETIELMMLRALTTDLAAPRGPWLAEANQIPMSRQRTTKDAVPRIPTQTVPAALFPRGFASASFVVTPEVQHNMRLNERKP